MRPDSSPDFGILDRRISKALDERGFVSGGGGGHIGGMGGDDGRLSRLENEVHSVKGALDWAKIAFSILIVVVVGGFGIMATVGFNLSSKMDSVLTRISDEFRSQRVDQAAQISAVANAIAATKQQVPQVILVPTPTPGVTPPK